VGNARQAAYYYRQAFGFSQFAYAGLETGRRDAASYAARAGQSPDRPDHARTGLTIRSTTTSGFTGTACATSAFTSTMPMPPSRRPSREG